jgi:hypothetical protein
MKIKIVGEKFTSRDKFFPERKPFFPHVGKCKMYSRNDSTVAGDYFFMSFSFYIYSFYPVCL